MDGLPPPYTFDVFGPLRIDAGYANVADTASGQATLLASNATGIAMRTVDVGAAPTGDLIAVAAYDDGVVFHDPRTLHVRGILGIRGAPGDVAISDDATIATADTSIDGATLVTRSPWNVRFVAGVPQADALAFGPGGALYATDRDVAGNGALSKLSPGGTIERAVVGSTPEGVAISPNGRRAYVANVNDGTISVVDTGAMREVSRTKIVGRVFSLALSGDGKRLYAVSNQSLDSPFSDAGSVVEVAVNDDRLHVMRKSRPLEFPLGVALDERQNRLFVTDESDSVIYVFDAATLRESVLPIATCRTPWQPHVDESGGRLYVPCARADRLDVFSLRTLARMPGSPFITGKYPLSVATWHRQAKGVRY